MQCFFILLHQCIPWNTEKLVADILRILENQLVDILKKSRKDKHKKTSLWRPEGISFEHLV